MTEDKRREIAAEALRLLREGGKENRRLAEDLCDEHGVQVYHPETNLTYYPNMLPAQKQRWEELRLKFQKGTLTDEETDEYFELGYPTDRYDDDTSLRGLWCSSSMRC